MTTVLEELKGFDMEFEEVMTGIISRAPTIRLLQEAKNVSDLYFKLTFRELYKPGSVSDEELQRLEEKYRDVATKITGVTWDTE